MSSNLDNLFDDPIDLNDPTQEEPLIDSTQATLDEPTQEEDDLFGELDESPTSYTPATEFHSINIASASIPPPPPTFSYQILRLPPYIHVSTAAHPFHPSTYQQERNYHTPSTTNANAKLTYKADFESIPDEIAAKIMQRVKTSIRFKESTMESNTRLIEWSDGTRSIAIGDLVYDFVKQFVPHDATTVSACISTSTNTPSTQILHYKMGDAESLWMAKAVGVDQILARASHLTLSDRTSPASVKKKSIKMMHVVDMDPEVKRQQLEKLENEKERARKKSEQQKRTRALRDMDKSGGGRRRNGFFDYGDQVDDDEDDLDAEWNNYNEDEEGFVEEDEEDEGGRGEWKASASGKKRWRSRNMVHKQVDSETSEEEEEEEAPPSPTLAKKKRRILSSDDEE